ncbi:hypothetical protein FOMPIDRAFT_83202 [Fomitopsis schrenkii]|uniref:tripeptidyl-peptidase II n=1 Tax=Fomitopsis schrenkii TaxID=2126942 RepID=S8G5Q6_FOMSC|nr:hypothetical protein FOMPIDRAFT_83202 [Fomitopsis schrenkii]
MVSVGLLRVAALLTLAASGVLGRSVRIPKSRRDAAPLSFTLAGTASTDEPLTLKIALTQSNPSGLEEALYDVSTPTSPNYGQHLSKEEAAAFVAPTSKTTAAVNSWLQQHGINSTVLTPAGDWLKIETTVGQANELFGANYNVYVHDTTGKQVLRTLEYSLPEELTSHITAVHPTVSFPSFVTPRQPLFQVSANQGRADAANSTAAASCSSTVTPACLASLYGIPTTKATQSSNKLGVTGYGDEYAQQADLKSFLKKFRTDIDSSTTFSLETLDGGSNPQGSSQAGVEANLDIQYTVGIATGVPVSFISVGEQTNDGSLGGFLDTVNYLLGEDSPPQVITTSYGDWEDDIESSLAVNLCNAYAQLGARGVSILFASGDGGVSGVQDRDCTTFVPEFPSGCPYITSVGGTEGVSPETAVSFSGGGFSNYWTQPDYQSDAVAKYLDFLGDTYSGLYNASGRGFPDVAAQAYNYQIVNGGSTEGVAGTSCSSPLFAGIVSLLNDELLAAGKSPLGFLNPWLYSTAASAFTDITSGNNPGCDTDGFSATTGWDPVTGLGTPVFSKLKTAAGL